VAKVIPIESSRYAKALKRRDLFLKSHPELVPLQREIDEKLRKAGSLHNRLVIIRNLMMDSFLEMDEKLQALVSNRR
jgi:ribosomal protein S24E